MKPRSEKRNCCACLYRVGFGVKRIGRHILVAPSVAAKWLRKSDVYEPKIRTENRGQIWKAVAAQRRALKPVKVKVERTKQTPEQEKEKRRAYYHANRETLLIAMRARAKAEWHQRKSDPVWVESKRQMARNWRARNRAYDRQKKKEWQQNNKARFRVLQRRARNKPQAKLANNFRRRVRDMIGKGLRVVRTQELIGCTRAFLVQWIESQFKRGMSWSNYGEWHIDHKVPCAAFDLTDVAQQRRCFHYSNLQPLWAEDNLAKSDSILVTQPELCMSIAT